MLKKSKTIDKLFLEAKVIIENTISDDEIKQDVSNFGYDERKLLAGKSIYDIAYDLYRKQKKDYGGQYGASEMFQNSWDETHDIYIDTLTVARVIFKRNINAKTSLMLTGRRKQSLSGWSGQAETFYKTLLNDKDLLSEMIEYGYGEEKLNSEYNMVKNVIENNLIQKKVKGEAQHSTSERDKKIEELGEWISKFKVIARIALKNKPQKLEKLGITVK